MSLPLDVAHLASIGIHSPYKSVSELLVVDPANSSRLIISREKVAISFGSLPHMLLRLPAFQREHGGGWGDSGIDWSLLPSLLGPSLVWFIAFMVIRHVCREPFARLGVRIGVAPGSRTNADRKRLFKFQNQLWLAIFYSLSTAFGYHVQHDKPWFTLPLTYESGAHLHVPQPYNPPRGILLYYQSCLAFYMCETVSLIFFERGVKRSDFLEYVLHHMMTIYLIVFSHLGLVHRVGAYIIFIHDASDIMLSVSKALHYGVNAEATRVAAAKKAGRPYEASWFFRYSVAEGLVNVCFVAFVVLFFFFRLWCLPHIGWVDVMMAPLLKSGNWNYWCLVGVVHVLLQGLHVYWASLIVSMVLSLLNNEMHKDVRSESDEEEGVDKHPAHID